MSHHWGYTEENGKLSPASACLFVCFRCGQPADSGSRFRFLVFGFLFSDFGLFTRLAFRLIRHRRLR